MGLATEGHVEGHKLRCLDVDASTTPCRPPTQPTTPTGTADDAAQLFDIPGGGLRQCPCDDLAGWSVPCGPVSVNLSPSGHRPVTSLSRPLKRDDAAKDIINSRNDPL